MCGVSKMVPSNFNVKVKGQHFKIQWANDYVIIYGQHYVNMWSKPCNIERKYLTVHQNETNK